MVINWSSPSFDDSRTGAITLRSRNESDSGGNWLVITVEDTGIGMEADLLERAFQIFEQFDRSTTRQFGGMGIGLAICKAIIDEHQGVIWASSAGRGKGSTFTIRLSTLRQEGPGTRGHFQNPQR